MKCVRGPLAGRAAVSVARTLEKAASRPSILAMRGTRKTRAVTIAETGLPGSPSTRWVLPAARLPAQEHWLTGPHRDLVKIEPRAGGFDRRADEIVVADGRAADRHQNVGAVSVAERVRDAVVRISRDADQLCLGARSFYERSDRVAVRCINLSVLALGAWRDKFIAGGEKRPPGRFKRGNGSVTAGRREQDIACGEPPPGFHQDSPSTKS